MITIVDIPTSEIFKYPDLPATENGAQKALEQYLKDVSKEGNTKREVDRVNNRDKDHLIVVATEAK